MIEDGGRDFIVRFREQVFFAPLFGKKNPANHIEVSLLEPFEGVLPILHLISEGETGLLSGQTPKIDEVTFCLPVFFEYLERHVGEITHESDLW